MDIGYFWNRFDRSGSCWIWVGAQTSDGYGKCMFYSGREDMVHRLAFAFSNGFTSLDDLDGLVIRHSCDVRLCGLPEHLISGTHEDNVQDRVHRNRSACGSLHGRAKLVEAEVVVIRAALTAGASTRLLARQYDVSPKLIRMIRKGLIWRSVHDGSEI